MADAFEVSLDYLVGAAEKQINKEMLNRIEEVDKMNRAGEPTLINAKCVCSGELCLTTILKLCQTNPEEKKMIYTFLDAFITKTKLQALM